MWNKNELDEGERILVMPVQPREGSDIRRETVRALMTRAVELVAARGGTMTAEEIADRERASKLSAIDMEDVFEHITSQGATVATLQAKVAEHLKDLGAADARNDALRSEIERLKAELVELEKARAHETEMFDHALGECDATAERWADAEDERDAAQAEVDRLKAEHSRAVASAADISRQSILIKSRLAAIRERANDGDGLLRTWNATIDALAIVNLKDLAKWNLEGDATQEAKCDHGSCQTSPCETCPTRAATSEAKPACVCRLGQNLPCYASHHPCSPTCTHLDAATPGHPERVRERSAALMAAEREYDNGRSAGVEDGLEQGYDAGVEAMRAACLEAAMTQCDVFGLGPAFRDALKAAVEGVAP